MKFLRFKTISFFVFLAFGLLVTSLAAAQVNIPNEDAWVPNGGVNKIVTSPDGTIYIGGTFTTIGPPSGGSGTPVSRNGLAAIDPKTGRPTSWNPNPAMSPPDPDSGADVTIYDLSISGSTIYVTGRFNSIGGQNRNRIAALDLATGLATPWDPNANNDVYTAIPSGSTIYVGGKFTNVGGQNRNRIAALDAATGLATAWNPNVGDFPLPLPLSSVKTLLLNGSTLYVGGWFNSLGGQARNGIGAVDTTTGLAAAWNPATSNLNPIDGGNNVVSFQSIAVNGSSLYAGGSFTSAAGRKFFAMFVHSVRFSSTAASGLESVKSVNIPVTLSDAHTAEVKVDYAVTGGTATGGGVDYTLASGTLTIPAGSTSAAIPLIVVNDGLDEPDKTVILTLSSPENAVLGSESTYTYTIQDDDAAPSISFGSAASSGDESTAAVTIPMNLSAASKKAVTVDYSVSRGTAGSEDYVFTSGTATFPAGATSLLLPLGVLNDTAAENDETIVIALNHPVNVTLGTNNEYTYTILDDDLPSPSDGGGSTTGGSGGSDENSNGPAATEGTSATYAMTCTNYRTGESCLAASSGFASALTLPKNKNAVAALSDGSFVLNLDPDKALDPDDPTKLSIVITAAQGSMTFTKFYGDLPSSSDVDIGSVDLTSTFSASLLPDREETGETTATQASPSCVTTIARSLFDGVSPRDDNTSGALGAAQQVLACLIAKNDDPADFGLLSFDDLISKLVHSQLTDAQVRALATAAATQCGLSEETLKTKMKEAKDLFLNLKDFTSQIAKGSDTCAQIASNETERNVWVESIKDIGTDDMKTAQTAQNLSSGLPELIGAARASGDYALFQNKNQRRVALSAAQQYQNASPQEMQATYQVIKSADLSHPYSREDLKTIGQTFAGIVSHSGTDLNDLTNSPGLISNYVVTQYTEGQFQNPNAVINNYTAIQGRLQESKSEIKDCQKTWGSVDQRCYDGIHLNQVTQTPRGDGR